MLYFRERYPLFLKCLQYYSEAGGSIGEAYDSIQAHFDSHNAVSTEVDPQGAYKIRDFGYPLSMHHETPCCNERHPLPLECFITFFGYIKKN